MASEKVEREKRKRKEQFEMSKISERKKRKKKKKHFCNFPALEIMHFFQTYSDFNRCLSLNVQCSYFLRYECLLHMSIVLSLSTSFCHAACLMSAKTCADLELKYSCMALLKTLEIRKNACLRTIKTRAEKRSAVNYCPQVRLTFNRIDLYQALFF